MSYQIITLSSPTLHPAVTPAGPLLPTTLILRVPKRPKKDSTKRDTKRWSLLQAFLTTPGTAVAGLRVARVCPPTRTAAFHARGRRGTFNSLFRRMKNSAAVRASTNDVHGPLAAIAP